MCRMLPPNFVIPITWTLFHVLIRCVKRFGCCNEMMARDIYGVMITVFVRSSQRRTIATDVEIRLQLWR